MSVNLHTAMEVASAIAAGSVTSETLVLTCLERIETGDPARQAWVHLDGEAARVAAHGLDEQRRAGKPLGALHGIPVGIGDTIDVATMPTRAGRGGDDTPASARDATLVAKLREAGALILGKTASGPFGYGPAAMVSNPYDPLRSAGAGGSAAAVAAGHAPFAVDRQQGGEIILSASYCGVFGLVPSRGMISRQGALRLSPTLDRIGVVARTLEDAAGLVDALTGYDAADSATYPRPKPRFAAGVAEAVPVEPNFVVLEQPYENRQDDATRAAFAELQEALAGRIEVIEVPASFGNVVAHRDIVLEFELHRALTATLSMPSGEFGPGLSAALARGAAIDSGHYGESLAVLDQALAFLGEVLIEFDAIMSPAAAGVAPARGQERCDTLFTAAFDFCGLPIISLPLLGDDAGLPLGVQLVGGLEEDARLCRSARWLQSYLAAL